LARSREYADATAYEKAQALFAQDPELQQVFSEIAKFAERISREMVVDLALSHPKNDAAMFTVPMGPSPGEFGTCHAPTVAAA
jgi:hypothetical protein